MRQAIAGRRTKGWILLGAALLVLSVTARHGTLAAPGKAAARLDASSASGRHTIELLGARFDPLVDGEPVPAAALRAKAGAAYALLQLADLPKGADLDALRAAGVVFHDPIAGNAYLVRLQASGAEALGAKRLEIASMRQVRWIGSLHGAYKIAPRTTGGKLILDVFPDADLAAVEAEALVAGAQVLERRESARTKLLVVEADDASLPALAAIDGVRWVQKKPVYRTVNDDARFVVQANERGSLPLYAHGLTGEGQVGAVGDSGLDAYDFVNDTGAASGTDPNDASCYFEDDGNAGTGGSQIMPSASHRKVVGYIVPAGAEGDYTDEAGHGTHVVGSVAGDQAPWGQVSPADGQAFMARIFFEDMNVGGGITVSTPADYNDLFAPAYDPNGNGQYEPATEPRTHSDSWGGADPTYDANTGQVDGFMWTHPDFLILFAAGNNGPGPSTIGNPGTAKDIISVGATENGDQNTNDMAQFSSHGPVPLSGPVGGANRMTPTIGAPGDGLSSALYKNPCGVQDLSGTSMATPTTHGVALLMRQYLWDGYYPHGEPTAGDGLRTPPPSAALLKALLINSGRRMTGLYTDNGTGGSWPSNGQGWGRVTADDVLYFQGDHRDAWLHDEYAVNGSTGFAANGESRTFTIQVGNGTPFDGEPLKITLDWTDYPGSMLDGGRLVNDLNLVVTDPAGGTHRGNDATQNDFADASDLPAAPDAVNPWEVVYLANPAPGTYTVTVTAVTLGSLGPDPGRKQGFALVATGDLRSRRGRAEIENATYDPIPMVAARLRVTDLDRNANPLVAESLTARLTSTTNPTGIVITLQETSANSATFAGQATLVVADQGQILGPGQLAVNQGDTIRLAYADADDGSAHAYEAYDTAKIQGPASVLLNPPLLDDPGATDPDGNYTLTWSPAESTNNNGLTKTLASYVVDESTNYALSLFDDAQGSLGTYWTTDPPGDPGDPPWVQSPAYNSTSGATPPQSYWSTANDTLIAFGTSLTLTQAVTIPSTVASARLTFYSRYFNEPDDTGNVEITTDDGAHWTELLRITDAPQVPPADTRMQHHEVDLTPYIGQPFRVRFRMDGGTQNFFLFETEGWWVDDVTISGATWSHIAVVPATQTQYQVTGRYDGTYSYRVRAAYTDGSTTAYGNVESITVAGAGVASGRVPDSLPDGPLTVAKNGGALAMQWGASCVATDTDYEVYEGTLGSWYSHAPLLCSTGGITSATVTPSPGSRYYLIVPRNATSEGSYGRNGSGVERPVGSSACQVQRIGGCTP